MDRLEVHLEHTPSHRFRELREVKDKVAVKEKETEWLLESERAN
jgi:hypothetical protein